MYDIQTSINGLSLTRPNPNRDAPFAFGWLASPHGKETLLLMGNPANKIETPSLKNEMSRMHDFFRT